jgi:hypothetical protein
MDGIQAFAMELHVHLGAWYATEPWVEHFDWLAPLFNEGLKIEDGRMLVPTRPGLGLMGLAAEQWANGKRCRHPSPGQSSIGADSAPVQSRPPRPRAHYSTGEVCV